MSLVTTPKERRNGSCRIRIVVPRGFPNGLGTGMTPTRRSLAARLPGAAGAVALHGLLLGLLLHFDPVRTVFGTAPGDDLEWIWLPEVTLAPPLPAEPPPPEPPPVRPPLPAPPPPEPVREMAVIPPPPPAAEAPPVSPVQAESEPPPVETAEPEPPPAVAETATAPPGKSDAWTKVRTDIMHQLRYPPAARRSGLSGVVILQLRLDASGNIVAAIIQPPVPDRALGEAVLAAVQRAGPFPAAGKAIRQGRIPAVAEIPIRFELSAFRR